MCVLWIQKGKKTGIKVFLYTNECKIIWGSFLYEILYDLDNQPFKDIKSGSEGKVEKQ